MTNFVLICQGYEETNDVEQIYFEDLDCAFYALNKIEEYFNQFCEILPLNKNAMKLYVERTKGIAE